MERRSVMNVVPDFNEVIPVLYDDPHSMELSDACHAFEPSNPSSGSTKSSRLLDSTSRLVFLGLVSLADDAGRLIDNVKLLDGQMFPNTGDTCGPPLDCSRNWSHCAVSYAVSGQRIIQLVTWTLHQKVDKPSHVGASGGGSDGQRGQFRDSDAAEVAEMRGADRPRSRDSRETLARQSRDPREAVARPSRDSRAPILDLGSRILDRGSRTEDRRSAAHDRRFATGSDEQRAPIDDPRTVTNDHEPPIDDRPLPIDRPVDQSAAEETIDRVNRFVAEVDFGPFARSVAAFCRATKNPEAVIGVLRMHVAGETGYERGSPMEVGQRLPAVRGERRGIQLGALRWFCPARQGGRRTGAEPRAQRRGGKDDRPGAAICASRLRRRKRRGGTSMAAFKQAHPNAYDAFCVQAEAMVPQSITMGRGIMVRAQVLQVIRQEGRVVREF